MQKILHQIFEKNMRPEPLLTVSDWADRFRVLSSKASAESGRWKTSRTPYLKKIMDCLSPTSQYQYVVVQKGAQVGCTEAGNNWLGYIIDRNPGPMMIVQPTLDMAKRLSKQRIDPLIEETPCISDKVKNKRSRDSSNTVFVKEFKGGIVILTGANSATGLRSTSIRYLMLDECDAFPGDVDNEGDPINLAIKRTATFSRKKIFMISTPTEQGRSNIEKAFQITDQNYYFVPCPLCKEKQILSWPQLQWDDDSFGRPDPRSIRYKCVHCQGMIEEHHKTWMLANGDWQATIEDNANNKRIGFHISSLYSPLGWYSWIDAVDDWHQAQSNQEKLKGFVNTVLGEVWVDKGDAPNHKRLYDRREQYKIGTVPMDGCVLTAAVDVQKDRLEVEVKAWGRDMRNWSVDYRMIIGDTNGSDVWDELAKLLSEQFDHESGEKLTISKLLIDSGFNTQSVYNWVRRYPIQRVCATKGSDSLHQIAARPSDVDVKADGKKVRRGAKLFMIGASMIKAEIYGWLKQDTPSSGQNEPYGFSLWPEYDEEYFKMLTAEELRKKKVKGFDRWYWEKVRDRNEALDLFVMNRAAAYLCGLDRYKESDWQKFTFAKLSKKIDNIHKEPQKLKLKRRKSEFFD